VDITVTNPGIVNVADEAYFPSTIEQTIRTSTPATGVGPTTQGSALAPGIGLPVLSPSISIPPQIANTNVDGDDYSPLSPNVINTTENTVIGQLYGNNHVITVFV
jgi:hypothetical protein